MKTKNNINIHEFIGTNALSHVSVTTVQPIYSNVVTWHVMQCKLRSRVLVELECVLTFKKNLPKFWSGSTCLQHNHRMFIGQFL